MSFLSRFLHRAAAAPEVDPRDEANARYAAALREREEAVQRRDTRGQHHAEARLREIQLERLRLGA